MVAGTLFIWELLLGEFRYLVVGENAQKVLKGEYEPPPGRDQHMANLLSFLRIHDNIGEAFPVSMVLSMEDYQ